MISIRVYAVAILNHVQDHAGTKKNVDVFVHQLVLNHMEKCGIQRLAVGYAHQLSVNVAFISTLKNANANAKSKTVLLNTFSTLKHVNVNVLLKFVNRIKFGTIKHASANAKFSFAIAPHILHIGTKERAHADVIFKLAQTLQRTTSTWIDANVSVSL